MRDAAGLIGATWHPATATATATATTPTAPGFGLPRLALVGRSSTHYGYRKGANSRKAC